MIDSQADLIIATVRAQDRVYNARVAQAAGLSSPVIRAVADAALVTLDVARRAYRAANPGLPVWLNKAYVIASEHVTRDYSA